MGNDEDDDLAAADQRVRDHAKHAEFMAAQYRERLAEYEAQMHAAERRLAEAEDGLRHAQAVREQKLAEIRRVKADLEAAKRISEARREGRMSEFLAEEVKSHREGLDMRQEDLATRMREAGWNWQRVTVAEVERVSRRVSLDELVALAAIFSVPVVSLVVPPTATDVFIEASDGKYTILPADDVRRMFCQPAEDWTVPGSVEGATAPFDVEEVE